MIAMGCPGARHQQQRTGGAPCRAELARGVLHVLAGRVLSLGSRGSGRRQVPSQPENRCAVTPIEHPVWSERTVDVTSEQTGIFYPLVARGSYVEAGIKVGYVTDYFGKTIFEARAPVAGVVLHICPLPSMKKGDTIMSIGVVAKSPPM